MKFILTTVAVLSLPTIATAKNFNDLSVGDATCIDVFGPWNKVGTIVQRNSSNQEILEVVLDFRPVCSLFKMDQGFISGC